MRGLRYYLDEDGIHGPGVATELRRRGIDSITALEAGAPEFTQRQYR